MVGKWYQYPHASLEPERFPRLLVYFLRARIMTTTPPNNASALLAVAPSISGADTQFKPWMQFCATSKPAIPASNSVVPIVFMIVAFICFLRSLDSRFGSIGRSVNPAIQQVNQGASQKVIRLPQIGTGTDSVMRSGG
jgi:hypothetical protein